MAVILRAASTTTSDGRKEGSPSFFFFFCWFLGWGDNPRAWFLFQLLFFAFGNFFPPVDLAFSLSGPVQRQRISKRNRLLSPRRQSGRNSPLSDFGNALRGREYFLSDLPSHGPRFAQQKCHVPFRAKDTTNFPPFFFSRSPLSGLCRALSFPL